MADNPNGTAEPQNVPAFRKGSVLHLLRPAQQCTAKSTDSSPIATIPLRRSNIPARASFRPQRRGDT